MSESDVTPQVSFAEATCCSVSITRAHSTFKYLLEEYFARESPAATEALETRSEGMSERSR
jgi:hypothetical protein